MKVAVHVIRSGSEANATLLRCDGAAFLIDAGGFTQAGLTEVLRKCGSHPEQISGLLVSHLHTDHFNYSAARVCQRFRIPIFIHRSASHFIASRVSETAKGLLRIFDWRPFKLRPKLMVHPLPLSHDADGVTCGFSFNYVHRGRRCRISMVTDLGSFDGKVLPYVRDSALLLWEANHDTEMLWSCPRISEHTKRRIAAERGHLSNEQAGEAILAVLRASKRVLPLRVLLAHISRHRNRPELALAVVRRILRKAGFADVDVGVASRDRPTECHIIDMSSRPPELRLEDLQPRLPLDWSP